MEIRLTSFVLIIGVVLLGSVEVTRTELVPSSYLNLADKECGVRQIPYGGGRTTTTSRKGKATNSLSSLSGEFPWMVSLRWAVSGARYCGGAILNRRYVLSAAHCFFDPSSSSMNPWSWTTAALGEVGPSEEGYEGGFFQTDGRPLFKRNNGEGGGQPLDAALNFSLEEVLIHPNFTRVDYSNDIAIIRLNGEIEWSEYVQPICLPNPLSEEDLAEEFPSSSSAYYSDSGSHNEVHYGGRAQQVSFQIAGWGSTSGNKSHYVHGLRKVDITRIYSNEDCQRAYSALGFPISESHLCAGSPGHPGHGYPHYEPQQQGSDACYGDSGGPLMATKDFPEGPKNATVAIGVIVGGKGKNCNAEYPGIYTRLSKHIDWIREVVIPDPYSRKYADNSLVIDVRPHHQ